MDDWRLLIFGVAGVFSAAFLWNISRKVDKAIPLLEEIRDLLRKRP